MPRRSFHEERRAECTSQLEDCAFQLSLSDRHHLNVRLSALGDETTRILLGTAVHDTTDWQYRDPDEVDDARPEQGASSSQADPSSLEGDLNEMEDTLEMTYDEVEGTGDRRYINAKEAGEILGIKGKTVLNRSNLPENDDRYIPSLPVAESNRKRFDREVIERLMKASDR